LAGFEPPAEPAAFDDVFFALLPPAGLVEAIMAVAQALRIEHRFSGRMQRADRLHVSLWGVRVAAEASPALAELATRVAAQIRREAFEVRFDRALSFAGNRPSGEVSPVVLTGEGANDGAAALAVELAASMPVGRAVATPHLTLAYDRQVVVKHAIEPICWPSREFVLIRNRVGSGHPYEILGRWPLGDRSPVKGD